MFAIKSQIYKEPICTESMAFCSNFIFDTTSFKNKLDEKNKINNITINKFSGKLCIQLANSLIHPHNMPVFTK